MPRARVLLNAGKIFVGESRGVYAVNPGEKCGGFVENWTGTRTWKKQCFWSGTLRVREAVSMRNRGPQKNNLRIGKRKPPDGPFCVRAVWWFLWLFGGGVWALQGLALPGHAFGAGLEDIRLDALSGGFGGGADGVAGLVVVHMNAVVSAAGCFSFLGVV